MSHKSAGLILATFIFVSCQEAPSLPQTEIGKNLYHAIVSGRYAASFSSPAGPIKLMHLDKIESDRLQKSLLSEGNRLLKGNKSKRDISSLKSIAMAFYVMNYKEAEDFMSRLLSEKILNMEMNSLILLYFGNTIMKEKLDLVNSYLKDENENIVLAARISCEKLGGIDCFKENAKNKSDKKKKK